jgi:hypothetical protein
MGKRKVRPLIPRRGERAKIVKEGLKAGMENDQIIGMVQDAFPYESRKKVQTMISRYKALMESKYA